MGSMRFVTIMALAASSLWLTGCASAPGSQPVLPSLSVFDAPATPSPSTEKAIVLLSAQVAGLPCAETRLVIARATGGGYATASAPSIASQFGNGTDVAVVELEPGEWHVVLFACRNGENVTLLGAPEPPGIVPWRAAQWQVAIASFQATKGQVTDAGVLTITRAKPAGFGQDDALPVGLAIASRTNESAALLRQRQPELVSALQEQLMVLADPASARPALLGKCRLVAEGASTGGGVLGTLTGQEPPSTGCAPQEAGASASALGNVAQ
jgi:hypothetical protein